MCFQPMERGRFGILIRVFHWFPLSDSLKVEGINLLSTSIARPLDLSFAPIYAPRIGLAAVAAPYGFAGRSPAREAPTTFGGQLKFR
jgi:hypothetical protein